jgi:excisionase family DNA binding protein
VSIDKTIATLIEAQLAPVRSDLQRLTTQLEALRRALPPLLLTPAEAAQVLRTSLSTVRRRIKDGSLPVNRLSGRPLVDVGAMHPVPEAEVFRLAVGLRDRSRLDRADE